MSEDEEVIFKENDLYKHLHQQGFVDFETFESSKSESLFKKVINKFISNRHVGVSLFKDIGKNPSMSQFDHLKVTAILNSKLLFMDDLVLIERLISNVTVERTKSNYKLLFTGAAASLLQTALHFRKGSGIYLPVGISTLFTVTLLWQYYKNSKEAYCNKMLVDYINLLQKLNLNINKSLRFLRELEIVSTGQVSTNNIGAAMYMVPQNVTDKMKELPPWKTFPFFRQYVAEVLVEAIKTLTFACNIVKNISSAYNFLKDYSSYTENLQILTHAKSIKHPDHLISIKELQLLNDTFLTVQSEYLKWFAFLYYPMQLKSSSNVIKDNKRELNNVIIYTKPKISDLNQGLSSQFNIQKLFLNHGNEISHIESSMNIQFKETANLQTDTHEGFLLMLSVIKEIRVLEDVLEDHVNFQESCNGRDIRENISKELIAIRNNLDSVRKHFDKIFNNIGPKKINSTCVPNGDDINNCTNESCNEGLDSMQDYKPNSAFCADTHDEVFIAISSVNSENHHDQSDDWCLERKPQIPKDLLLELSTTLVPIKKEFQERERAALNRLGVEDITNQYDEINESEDEPRFDRSQQLSEYQLVSDFDFERTNVSLENITVERHHLENTLKTSKLIPADAHNINITAQKTECVMSDKSVALLVAEKSKAWRETLEECFTDE